MLKFALKIMPLVLVLAACAVSPTGRQQFIAVSSQQLDAMGARAFSQLKQTKRQSRNRQLNNYVNCVARAVTSVLPGGAGAWEVRVFEDRSINAFALPGGKIGVNTGLLRVARNQDQLAAVIGHEVGHVLANHANERASQDLLVKGGLSVLEAGGGVSPGWIQALGLGAQLGVLLPYSRIHESEADLIGVDIMARAGFDPRQSLQLWQNMAQAGGGEPPEFFSSHPASGTRLRDLQAGIGPALRSYEIARSQGRRPRCA